MVSVNSCLCALPMYSLQYRIQTQLFLEHALLTSGSVFPLKCPFHTLACYGFCLAFTSLSKMIHSYSILDSSRLQQTPLFLFPQHLTAIFILVFHTTCFNWLISGALSHDFELTKLSCSPVPLFTSATHSASQRRFSINVY